MAEMKALLAATGFLAMSTMAAEYPRSLDLPEDAVVRSALQRVSVRSGVSLPRSSWPLLAREAREFLDQVAASDSQALTAADSVALADLIVGPRELYRWSGSGPTVLALNARAGGEWTGSDSGVGHSERMGWLGGRIYGVVGGDLWFYSDARIFTRWSNKYVYWDRYTLADGEPSAVPFDDPSVGGRYKSNTGARYTAWAQWTRDWVTLKYGRDRVQFGPGVWTGLTTDYSTPPYQMLDVRVTAFPWLSVQATVLEARPGEVAGGISFPGDARKWMHVHRFEIRPVDGLALAFQNQVLYGDSGGVNPAYLLPLVPIFFSQDLSGNRDNAAMQFDASYVSKWGAKAWSALLIDDLNSVSDIGGASWLNRWALLVGGQVISPWKAIDADAKVEFSEVRPWTFTDREEAFTFAHYGMPMGTELGPDSRTFHVRLAWRPFSGLEIGSEMAWLKKGLGSQATLGDIHGRDPQDGNFAKWFSNGSRSDLKFGGDVAWKWNHLVRTQAKMATVTRSQSNLQDRTWLEGGANWDVDW